MGWDGSDEEVVVVLAPLELAPDIERAETMLVLLEKATPDAA